MCLDCGCMQPDNDHGDDRHIVMEDLAVAAKLNNKGAYQVLENIQKAANAVLEGKLESAAVGHLGTLGHGGAPD